MMAAERHDKGRPRGVAPPKGAHDESNEDFWEKVYSTVPTVDTGSYRQGSLSGKLRIPRKIERPK